MIRVSKPSTLERAFSKRRSELEGVLGEADIPVIYSIFNRDSPL